MAEMTLVLRARTADDEAERILDQLEFVTGLRGERVEGARRYSLAGAKDEIVAIASIRVHLDEIDEAWPTHLGLDLE